MPVPRLAGGLVGGLSATLFMEHASTWMYARQDQQSRHREEQLRTEMPTTTLVRKTAALLATELDDQRAATLGTLSHYTFGAAGGPARSCCAVSASVRSAPELPWRRGWRSSSTRG